MFKKRVWKYVVISLAWAVSLGGLVVLMSFIEKKKSEVVCTNVKIYIPGNQFFIDRQEVDNILGIHAHELIGRKLDSINIHGLEARLKANPFIAHARVYHDMDGVVTVEISQRQPILRMINRHDQNFYIDQDGLKLPLSANFTARVLVANGYIDETFGGSIDTLHTPLAKAVFRTADFIRKDSLWNAQFAEIYVRQDGDIELVPRVGNNRILIGNADSLETKFGNLLAFYKQAVPNVGWDAYKEINLKYCNQVIGVKNDNLMKDSLLMKKPEPDTTKTVKDTSVIRK